MARTALLRRMYDSCVYLQALRPALQGQQPWQPHETSVGSGKSSTAAAVGSSAQREDLRTGPTAVRSSPTFIRKSPCVRLR